MYLLILDKREDKKMTSATMTMYERLHAFFQDRVRMNEPLAQHCALGIGGPADIWIRLETLKELRDLVQLCAEEHYPLLVIGNGTNTIFSEEGVRGIVAHTAMQNSAITAVDDETLLFQADAGVRWSPLSSDLAEQGWAGLEFGIDIPGTLGAGLVSNAGAHQHALSETLEWIEALDARGCNMEQDAISQPVIHRYTKEQLDLGYHSSRFNKAPQSWIDAQGQIISRAHALIEPAEIVLQLCFRLHHETPQTLTKKLADYHKNRQITDPRLPHTGLIFVDQPGALAKDLITQAGLHGKTIGQACLSEQNANYICNLGNATSADVRALITEAHQRVLDRFAVNLQLNVEFR
jgi:UDP-N-acetylmuramate dehydrogenase